MIDLTARIDIVTGYRPGMIVPHYADARRVLCEAL